MAHSRIIKIRNGIKNSKYATSWKWKMGIATASVVLIFVAIWWITLPSQNYGIPIAPIVSKPPTKNQPIITDQKPTNNSATTTTDQVIDRFKYLGWWGEINANWVSVRKGMAITSDKLGTLSTANRVKVIKEVYGELVGDKNLWYQIDGGAYPGAYIFSDFVTPMEQPAPPKDFAVPDGVKSGENWIDVNLTKKVLTLFNYDLPIFATYISPGRTENPTQIGTYRVWYKLLMAEMKGGPPLHQYKYDLKNIPWVMYYDYDYAIHGTYWHDKFGTAQSAGCTNMTQGDAKFIFDHTLPQIPNGKKSAVARDNTNHGTGTVVFNHE